MQLDPHIDALQADLAELASLGDESVAAAAARLSQALRGSARVRLLELLSEAAFEVSAQLPDGHVELRLAGPDPTLVHVAGEAEAAAPVGDEAADARITLRLPESLKASVEAAASREGLSVNTWLVRALTRSVSGGAVKSGKRLQGFARS
jgi:hypothetical protein